jgi:hypothetical protein
MRYKGVVGLTVPAVVLSRKTVRLAGYEKPLVDTTSDPCNGGVPVGVTVNRDSVVAEDEFFVFLPVVVTHPAAQRSPITMNTAHSLVGFIEGSGTGRMNFFE